MGLPVSASRAMNRRRSSVLAGAVLSLYLLSPPGSAMAVGAEVDFAKDVKPILEESCLRCHGAPDAKKRPSANLRLDDRAAALRGGKSGKAIVPVKAADSLLYKVLLGPVKAGGREIPAMPKAMGPGGSSTLDPAKIDLIKRWIDQGAR